MSRLHGRLTAQNFLEFAQNLENCMRNTKNVCISTSFFSFFFMIHIYYVSLGVVFALFLAQSSKTKVLTAHKNILLECLCFWLLLFVVVCVLRQPPISPRGRFVCSVCLHYIMKNRKMPFLCCLIPTAAEAGK